MIDGSGARKVSVEPRSSPAGVPTESAAGPVISYLIGDFEYWKPECFVALDSDVLALCFFEPIRQVMQERGLCGAFMGLRAEESRARLLNRAVRGTLYTLKSGITHCNPLSDWTAADVWGYTVANDLPERIREGWFVPGGHSSSRGGMMWLKVNYPECYKEVVRRYPEYAAQV